MLTIISYLFNDKRTYAIINTTAESSVNVKLSQQKDSSSIENTVDNTVGITVFIQETRYLRIVGARADTDQAMSQVSYPYKVIVLYTVQYSTVESIADDHDMSCHND